MKKIFILLLTLSTTAFFGQQSYYDDIDLSLYGMALKNELATKITNTHTNNLSYNQVREAIKIVDLVPGQGTNVYLVYGFASQVCPASSSNDNDHRRRNKSAFGGSSSCEWNREHSYPKSLGTPNLGTSGPGADAHMLRACDVQRNGERSSKKFKAGSGNSHTVDSDYWYPGDEWKGDMARMMMYMYLRYGDRCLPINVGVGATVANDANMIDLFLQWNAEDPVSDYEKYRNNYLENVSNTYGQGNRNPFIDNPFLATRIWGGEPAEDIWGIYIDVDEYLIDQITSIYPNPTANDITIKSEETINRICFFNLLGQEMLCVKPNTNQTQISLSNLNIGTYFMTVDFPNTIKTYKVVKIAGQ